VAPGVLAANAMTTAVSESTWPVMGAVKWQRQYHVMLAAPLGVRDVLLGHLAFVLLRLGMVSVVFGVVAALLGALTSWWAVAAVAVAVLGGAAYATPVMAFAAAQENDAISVYLSRFGLLPTFLFAGTFFPVDQLPQLFRPVAYVMPLWHATQSCRDLALGNPDLLAVGGHCTYLLLWAAVGVAAAARTFRRRLVE
jgi:lipooligosaccharide transport system permease protein